MIFVKDVMLDIQMPKRYTFGFDNDGKESTTSFRSSMPYFPISSYTTYAYNSI